MVLLDADAGSMDKAVISDVLELGEKYVWPADIGVRETGLRVYTHLKPWPVICEVLT